MVPRWSLPAITKARRTPAIGFCTTCSSDVSHLPAMPVTLSFPERMRLSMSGLLPMVPTSTTLSCWGTVSVETAGSTSVTRLMSACRSVTTRWTPAKSAELTTMGAALPEATSGKRPGPDLAVMYVPRPLAFPDLPDLPAAGAACAVGLEMADAAVTASNSASTDLKLLDVGRAARLGSDEPTTDLLIFRDLRLESEGWGCPAEI